MDNLLNKINKILIGKELKNSLENFPINECTKDLSQSERVIKLKDIYDVYIPNEMSYQIYNQLYFSLLRSMKKKQEYYESKQMIKNREVMKTGYSVKGINMDDCSLIVGVSGVGKTLSIKRAIEVISNNKLIELEEPYMKIITFLFVEASPIVSVKGFYLQIFRAIDERLGTNYYESNCRSTASADTLLGALCNLLITTVGVLIIDETDRLVENRKSITFVNAIVSLINLSGISIIFCGTLACLDFFNTTPYLNRRSLGCVFRKFDFNDDFFSFIKVIFDKYQYTNKKTILDTETARFIFDRTNGVKALIVQLIISAQEYAILSGYERLDINSLTYASNIKLELLKIDKRDLPLHSKVKEEQLEFNEEKPVKKSIFDNLIKNSNKDINRAIQILMREISIKEIIV